MIKRIFSKVTAIQVISLSAFAILIASVLGVGYLLLQDRDRVVNNNDRLIQIYDDLYKQTQAQGIEPTTPDPSSVKSDSEDGTLVGPRGATGSVGAQGAVGPRGPQGEMGERGQTGPQGAPGEPGVAGKDGLPGAAGAAGAKGEAGAKGADGAQGAPGIPGAQGPAGPQGAPGVNGMDGRGIQSLACNADGSWTVAYTDGTSMVTPGPCRVSVDILR